MHRRWKKRLKGAISIFLTIIFVSNYALIGLLVDSGRLRMARAVAEGALDNAGASILSYYNRMLYDLYGLFATDSLSEEAITQLLADYAEKTLGTVPVEESALTSLVDAVTGAVGGLTGEEELPAFDLYSFDTEITLVDGASHTLANTEAVEAQIIDHMKYRAPESLFNAATSENSFLGKLQGLLNLTDRIRLTKDKLSLTKSKENLFKQADDLGKRVDAFNQKVRNFAASPTDMAGGGAGYDTFQLLRELDDAFEEIGNRYEEPAEESQPAAEDSGDGSSESTTDSSQDDEWIEKARADYEKEMNATIDLYNAIFSNAQSLYDEANSLRDETYRLVNDFNTYIGELNAKIKAEKESEDAKTVFLPEVELAEGTCGEMLKNIELVLNSRGFTLDITDQGKGFAGGLTSLVSEVINLRLYGGESSVSTSVETTVTKQMGTYGNGANDCLITINSDLSGLYELASQVETRENYEIKTVDSNGDKANENAEKDTKKDDLRSLNADDLAVPFETTDEPTWSGVVSGSLSTEDTGAVLDAGLDLIEKIGQVLEGARDSLYINEYAIAYFPNYVQHYNAADSDLAKNADNTYLIDESKYFAPYNASQAELEYILTGNANTTASVATISAQLLGIRMVLNTAAIFTDSAKVTQANTLAAAISGPFAPLVSAGLLIAWALAESALDVADLLAGKDVELFKQGTGWKISVEGLVSEAVGKAVDYVSGEVTDAVNGAISNVADTAKQATNKAIYDAYNAGMDEARETVSKWSESLSSEAAGLGGSALTSAFDQGLSGAEAQANALLEKLDDGFRDSIDPVLVQVNAKVDSVSDRLQEQVSQLGDQAAEKATQAITDSLNKILPSGQVVNTGSNTGKFSVTLNYMDYMRIFLLFASNTTKVQRIQQLVQANLRYGGQSEFSMAGSYVSVASKLDGSTRFLFMSAAFLPMSMKQDGRMNFTVYSRMGY